MIHHPFAQRLFPVAVALVTCMPALAIEEVWTLDGKPLEGNPSYVRNGELRCKDKRTGKLVKVEVLKDGSARFVAHCGPNGSFYRLTCHNKDFVPKDFLKTCGYEGASEVTLCDDESGKTTKKTLINGESAETVRAREERAKRAKEINESDERRVTPTQQTSVSNFANGKPQFEVEYLGHQLNGFYKEFHESGKLIRHAVFAKGVFQEEKTWFLNGKLKSESKVELEGTRLKAWTRTFEDTGVLALEQWFEPTAFMVMGRNYRFGNPVHAKRYEKGALVEESFYQKGTLSSRKTFDAKGKVLKSEEFYEDGSRK